MKGPKTRVQVLDISNINLSDDEKTALSPTIESDATDPQSEFMRPTIKLSGEGIPFETYIIGSEETYIGRDPNQCQICIDHPEISRLHAVIKRHQSNFWIEDLLSSGGTHYEGRRINKTDLVHGSEVTIGPVTFQLLVDSPFIQKEKKRLMPVDENESNTIYEERDDEDSIEGDFLNHEDEYSHRGEEALNAREKWLYPGFAVLVLAFLIKSQINLPKTEPITPKRTIANIDQVKGTGLTLAQDEFISDHYQLAKELFKTRQYKKSLAELDTILIEHPKDARTKALREIVLDSFRSKEARAQRLQKKSDLQKKELLLQELIKKAELAFKEKKLLVASGYTEEILRLDPQNLDGDLLRREIAQFKVSEAKRIKKENLEKKVSKKFNQQFSIAQLAADKNNNFAAIAQLEKMMGGESNSERLAKVRALHGVCSKKLKALIAPRLNAARQAKRVGDLKLAYQKYQEVLTYHPNHSEAFREGKLIMGGIEVNTRKVYREAIVLESMSLFDEAREKLETVLEQAPSDNQYHKKATKRLSQYQ